jgi:hypothetical protein
VGEACIEVRMWAAMSLIAGSRVWGRLSPCRRLPEAEVLGH